MKRELNFEMGPRTLSCSKYDFLAYETLCRVYQNLGKAQLFMDDNTLTLFVPMKDDAEFVKGLFNMTEEEYSLFKSHPEG